MSCIIDNINVVGGLTIDYLDIDLEFLKGQEDLNSFIQVNEHNRNKKYTAFGDNGENNVLIGADCNRDRLVGKDGDDLLIGGKDTSVIKGGAGDDVVYLRGNSYVVLGEGCDVLNLTMFKGTSKNAEIKDFKIGEDRIVINRPKDGINEHSVYIQRGELHLNGRGSNIQFEGVNDSKERLYLELNKDFDIF